MSDQLKIDFQHPDHRWAAQMACDEANAARGTPGFWRIHEVSPRQSCTLYALAIRILRTETDPLIYRAREIAADAFDKCDAGVDRDAVLAGEVDKHACVTAVLVALKEGRGQ
jgi:hypothetical protein